MLQLEPIYADQEIREYIEDQIQESKAEAVKMLHKYVDPFFAQAIAVTIACALENGLDEALDIVNRTGLTDKHLAALRNDETQMCEIIKNEVQENKYYKNC